MSTVHHICSECFHSESRGFTFTGSVPVSGELPCPACGHELERVSRISAAELGDRTELVWAGTEFTLREPRWERLRQTILTTLKHLWRVEVVSRQDGLIEIPLHEELSLVIRPVHDEITGQQGCLLASPLRTARAHAHGQIRGLLREIDDVLGERSLMLGTLRDLFTLADASPTVLYRRFVSVTELVDAEYFAAILERAGAVSRTVHLALDTFGFTHDAVRFVERSRLETPSLGERPDSADWEAAAHDLMAGAGALDREELLGRSEPYRTERAAPAEVRERLSASIRGLGLDVPAQALASVVPLTTGPVYLELELIRDDRDDFIEIRSGDRFVIDDDDDELAGELAHFTRTRRLGDLILQRDEDGDLIARVREVLVATSATPLEIADALRGVAESTATLADLLGAVIAAPPKAAMELATLLEMAERAAVRETSAAREERITREIRSALGTLQLHPFLTRDGGFGLRFDDVEVHLRTEADARHGRLVASVTLVDTIGAPLHQVVAELADRHDLTGGFVVTRERALLYEDVVPATRIGVANLARLTHELSQRALQLRMPFEQRFAGETQAPDTPTWLETTVRLTERFRSGPDDRARARILRVLNSFDNDATRRLRTMAMRDPSSEVAAAAIAGLVADLANHDADRQPESLKAMLTIALDSGLARTTRRRAVRVLAAMPMALAPVVRGLERIVFSTVESTAMRSYALSALAALGSHKPVIDALVRAVSLDEGSISRAALRALGQLDAPDSARLFLAAQAAVEDIDTLEPVDQASVLSTLAQLQMQQTVVDLIGDRWTNTPELSTGLASAAAAHDPPHLEPLRALLASRLGAHREAALAAIEERGLAALADDIAELVLREGDRSLRRRAIRLLESLRIRSEAVLDALRSSIADSFLRDDALAVMASLQRSTGQL